MTGARAPTPAIPPMPAWLIWTLAVLLPVSGLVAAEFEAGFATADITPSFRWRRAGGYTKLVSTGVNDPLLAKAMVLSQGATALALVGNDLCSVPRELPDRARDPASERTGVPVAQIVITATHTHGGPEYYGPLRDVLHARARQQNDGKDPHESVDYQSRLVECRVELIAKAHAARKPALRNRFGDGTKSIPRWSSSMIRRRVRPTRSNTGSTSSRPRNSGRTMTNWSFSPGAKANPAGRCSHSTGQPCRLRFHPSRKPGAPDFREAGAPQREGDV